MRTKVKESNECVQAALPWFLIGKVQALGKALKKVPELALRAKSSELSTLYTERDLARELQEYQHGLHSNPVVSEKPLIYKSDEIVSHVLARLHIEQRVSVEEVDKIVVLLEKALDNMLSVCQKEETRSRIYCRKGEAQPQKSPNNRKERK